MVTNLTEFLIFQKDILILKNYSLKEEISLN